MLTISKLSTHNSNSSSLSLTNILRTNSLYTQCILEEQLNLVKALNYMTNVIILASSNDALHLFLNNTAMARILAFESGAIAVVLSYHVLNSTYSANNFTDISMFIKTMLENSTYENVTSGQVVKTKKDRDMVSFYNLNFTGGFVYIINYVLEILMNLFATDIAVNLIVVTTVILATHLTDNFIDMQSMTMCMLNNSAFVAIASVVGNLSNDNLQSIFRVFNLSNKSSIPNPTTTEPAFCGASTVTATGLETLTTTAAGVQHATTAVAFGALFGGAAMVMDGL
ncbi:hypothetical protein B7463_g3027, partial [Scytalidium lignicola]